MSAQSTNPLSKYFRQPAIHLTLPSGGKYWPDGSLEMNMSGQLEIYPMTTKDEITIRTPDALLNGSSTVSLIQSCIPQIKDAWMAPTIDIDAIIIAIRIASYGQNMDIDTICPNQECKHENRHAMDLTMILDGVKSPNYNKTVDINNIKIKLKPVPYFDNNKTKIMAFEQERAMSIIGDDTLSDEEKITSFQNHLNKIIDINTELMAAAVEYVEIEDGIRVSERQHIDEFLNNCDTKIVKALRTRFEEFNKFTELPKPRMSCEECGTEYPVELNFDYANFFVNAS